MYDCVSDLAVYSPLGTSSGVNAFTRATMNAASGGNPDSRWAETYTGIRKANVILRNIDYTENIVEIEGGNHAQFGNYGPQKGDLTAAISAEEQQAQTVATIEAFLWSADSHD